MSYKINLNIKELISNLEIKIVKSNNENTNDEYFCDLSSLEHGIQNAVVNGLLKGTEQFKNTIKSEVRKEVTEIMSSLTS